VLEIEHYMQVLCNLNAKRLIWQPGEPTTLSGISNIILFRIRQVGQVSQGITLRLKQDMSVTVHCEVISE